MVETSRKRVDLSRLPPVFRYGLALAVVAVVVLIVIMVAPPDAAPAGWYTVVVTVGALVVLVLGAGWLLRHLWRAATKPRS